MSRYQPLAPNDGLDTPSVEWKYEMRRESQEILPGIFVGPSESSKSLDALRSLGITSVLILRAQHETLFVRPRFPDQLAYCVLEVADRQEQNLIRIYPLAREFIQQTLNSGGKVLVHCDGGISRAPAIVVMYVMELKRTSYEDAMMCVQARRYCVHMNQGFICQMKEWEAIYQAQIAHHQQQLQQSHQANPQTQMQMLQSGQEHTRRKREMEEDDDEMEQKQSSRRFGSPMAL